MDKKKKRDFRVLNNESEYEKKLKAHRMRVGGFIFLLFTILVIAVVAVILILKYRGYQHYEVVSEEKMEMISEAAFYDYDGDILKVSKNGAILIGTDGEKLFNVSYEMNDPIVDICGSYIAVAGSKASDIYIMNASGLKGHIVLTKKIRQIEVASQGTVAVLTEDKGTYYINLYDTDGNELVEGAMHLANTGYPLTMDLSYDAKLLAVSVIDIGTGRARTTLNFYNFGSVGQNEIDNKVASYTYEDTVVPRVLFFEDGRAVAVGDNKVIFYKGNEVPEEDEVIDLATTIRAICHNGAYLALCCEPVKEEVASGNADATAHVLCVYDTKGKELYRELFNENFDSITFLENNDLFIDRGGRGLIYSINGTKKFEGDFAEQVITMASGKATNEYYILYRNRIQRVRLKR
ncbi:MAG: DUF5711 family protein [Lachnospiraceae bacterium]|nr:DUF5711 family protein [Lachnospiraceae bacterium]